MPEATLVKVRLSVRYQAEAGERRMTFTYPSISLLADDDQIYEFAEAVTELQEPVADEIVKIEVSDLAA